MLTFAVVAARPGTRVPARVQAILSQPRPAEVPFTPSSHLQWINETGSVAVAGWQDTPDGTDVGRHWEQSGEGITAFTGDPWPRRKAWQRRVPWARQLSEHLRSHPLAEGTDGLLGVFTIVCLAPSGDGAVAADVFGMGHVYWGANDEVTVASPRASLAAELLAATGDRARPPRDPFGAGWVAFADCPQGVATSFADVKVLAPDDRLEIIAGAGARLVPGRARLWTFEHPIGLGIPELLAEIRDDIAAVLRRVVEQPVERRLMGLTGGVDSRTLLAMMLDEDVTDAFEFETAGTPDLPDVVIAKEIAAAFGLRHHGTGPQTGRAYRAARADALRASAPQDASDRELALRLQVGMSSGMRNLMHPYYGHPPTGRQVLLSGYCGEGLRTNYPRYSWVQTREQALSFPFSGLKFGGAGILQPGAQELYERQVLAMLLDGARPLDAPRDLIDAWYLRNRFRRWRGPDQELNATNTVYPLYSVVGIRTAHAIDPDERGADRIPYELIRRACPRLLDIPLQGGGWSERLAASEARFRARSVAEREQPRGHERSGRAGTAAFPVPAPGPRTVGSDRRRGFATEDREIMLRYFSDASNPVFEVVDQRAVLARVHHFDQVPEGERRQIYGALTAAIWLGRHELTDPGPDDG